MRFFTARAQGKCVKPSEWNLKFEVCYASGDTPFDFEAHFCLE